MGNDDMTYDDLDDYQQGCYDFIKGHVERFLGIVPFTRSERLATFCAEVKPPPRQTYGGVRFEFRFKPGGAGTYVEVRDLWKPNHMVDLTMDPESW